MIETYRLPTTLVPSPVVYRVVAPERRSPAADGWPLLLCLHGGVGGHDIVHELALIIEAMWGAAVLPEMLAVMPETGHSFYLDYRDRSQRWETFLTQEFLPHIRERHLACRRPDRTLVGGISMGGMGALRLGLKHPDLFGAIVAWEPSIEPAFAWNEVKLEDRFWRSAECMEARFGRPIDEAYWASNNPATIARNNARAIRDSDIRIYLEVGTDDAYGLYRGAEFMHRALFDHGIRHEYRCVYGADHIGATIPHRLRDGLGFVAGILRPAGQDQRVEQLRQLVAMQKRSFGMPAGEAAPRDRSEIRVIQEAGRQ